MQTKIFSVDPQKPNNAEMSICASLLKDGGLVAFPTETVYGLGAIATDKNAAKKIYAAKGRPSDNPLIIHIADPKDAERYAYTSELYYKLSEGKEMTVTPEMAAAVISVIEQAHESNPLPKKF